MAKTHQPLKSEASKTPISVKNIDKKAPNFLVKNSRNLLYLLVITILYIPIYNHIFDEKVALLGDNAAYYIFAKGLANGDGYVNTHIYGKPKATQFPPGYPAFTAGVMKVFGDDFTTIKKANGVLLWLSLIILFFFFKKISKNIHLSFVITVVLIFNMHLLQYSTWMMSEIPFIFISTLSLWLLTLANFEEKPWKNPYFILAIIAAAGSYYVRGQGLAIIFGILFFLLFEKKWLYAGLSSILYFLLLLPWSLRNSGLPDSPYQTALKLKNYYNPSEGEMMLGDWFDRFFNNMERYLAHEIPSSVFSYTSDYQSQGHIFAGIFISALIIIGFIKLKNYRWAVGGYLLTTFGILFLWPEIWYGIRFVLALVPILTFLFAYGVLSIFFMIGNKLKIKDLSFIETKLPYVFVIFIFAFIGKLEILNKEASKNLDPLFRNYYAAAQWSKANLPDTAVIICRKPDLFYLQANRFVEGFTKVSDMNEFLKSLNTKKATHIVVYGDGITQNFFIPVYEKNPEKFPIIQQFKNPDVWILEYKPELGYSGEWKNGVKEGTGIYIYPDGKKFEGEWKNNNISGHGILYSPAGEKISEGEWENGQLINTTK